jgi:GMP reductase
MKMLNYDDIYLVPKYSTLDTRKNADTSFCLGSFNFKLPLVPSNMKAVINDIWASWLSENDYFYVMHRFDNITVPFVKYADEQKLKTVSISTGINNDSYEELLTIKKNNWKLDFITIDVAHGHHIKVEKRIHEIKNMFPDVFIIAGNVTTREGVEFLENAGADATKIGIGPGKACTTKLQTGFHVPMFSAILQCSPSAKKPLIADGGINHYGDIAKALTAGASCVMAGSLFASCKDSPATSINGKKIYYGSASSHNKGHNSNIEGTLLELESSVSLKDRLSEITQSLQSSISYAGGKNLTCFNSVEYITC